MTQLLGVLSAFLLLVAVIILLTSKRNLRMRAIGALVVFFALIVVAAYYNWGGAGLVAAHEKEQAKQQLVKSFLKEYDSTDAVIKRMEMAVATKKTDPRGWYLLGRLYTSAGYYDDARRAFKEAYRLDKTSINNRMQYAMSIFATNHQKRTPLIDKLVASILKDDPDQLDTLNFKATMAYVEHDYKSARELWARVLIQLPPASPDADKIRKLVANADKLTN